MNCLVCGDPAIKLILEEDERVYHQYYQWVPLFLTLQAVFFYAPHWIWKQLDNGKMNVIAK